MCVDGYSLSLPVITITLITWFTCITITVYPAKIVDYEIQGFYLKKRNGPRKLTISLGNWLPNSKLSKGTHGVGRGYISLRNRQAGRPACTQTDRLAHGTSTLYKLAASWQFQKKSNQHRLAYNDAEQ